jgi:hypothetical protein
VSQAVVVTTGVSMTSAFWIWQLGGEPTTGSDEPPVSPAFARIAGLRLALH